MMNLLKTLALLLTLLSTILAISAQERTNPLNIQAAESSFNRGDFAEAERLCKELLQRDRHDFQAVALAGQIALISNRLNEAQKQLSFALTLKPEDKTARQLLAEVFYRRDEFQRAAQLQRELGNNARAALLESFKGQKPYQREDQQTTAHLKFVQTDPLPLVSVRVNRSEEVYFLIDTGGAEVVLDTEFAKRLGVVRFGEEAGVFAGGKRSAYQLGRVDSMTLGEITIKNVPVQVLDTRRFDAVAGGRHVEGIIGTVLLYHFLSTLDYVRGELTLRPQTKTSWREFIASAQAEKQIEVPFWMAGDHFMAAWGRVNQRAPMLLLVDTGLAGMGFTGPDSTLKEAGIKLPEGATLEGVGGGGRTRATPMTVDDISLGAAREKNIAGVAGVFPPSLEISFGFRLGGLLSHSFFRPYALTIDFTGMRFYLRRT